MCVQRSLAQTDRMLTETNASSNKDPAPINDTKTSTHTHMSSSELSVMEMDICSPSLPLCDTQNIGFVVTKNTQAVAEKK